MSPSHKLKMDLGKRYCVSLLLLLLIQIHGGRKYFLHNRTSICSAAGIFGREVAAANVVLKVEIHLVEACHAQEFISLYRAGDASRVHIL
jgi:hypothetical protein